MPDNPGAWLMATAKRRAIDQLRRGKLLERKHEELGHELETAAASAPAPDLDAALDDDVGDDLLRLVFTSCHPGAVDRGARRAHAAPARRADDRGDRARLPRPGADDRAAHRARQAHARRRTACRSRCRAATSSRARLASVLEVIYLIFNEGYSATAGDDWMRPALCEDALRLGRILAELAPGRAGGARPGRADGDPGVALARRASGRRASRCCCSIRIARAGISCSSVAASPRSRAPSDSAARTGRYALQAAIAACHARARTAEETDWARIAALYEALGAGRAVAGRRAESRVAVAMAFGPAAGLALVDALRRRAVAASYHLLPSVRGDLLAKLGRLDEARAEFERAAALTRNARERELLLARAANCSRS